MLLEEDASLFFFRESGEPTSQGQNESPAVWEKDVEGSRGQGLGESYVECQIEGKTVDQSVDCNQLGALAC